MWWSENVVPRSVERSVSAAFLTIVGFVGALLAPMLVMPAMGGDVVDAVVPDRVGAWVFWHPETWYVLALGCGLALALVVDRRAYRRP
jgi:hypothetical protein